MKYPFPFLGKKPFVILAIIFALFYWLTESVVHYLIFNDPIEILPHDSHEWWMRLTNTGFIILLGFISNAFADKLVKTEREKADVYISMIRANNHILNNFLNKMYLFKLEAEESEDFDKEILSQYSVIIEETKAKIKNLEGLEDPQKDSIEQRLKQSL